MDTTDITEVRIHGRGGQGAVLTSTVAAEVAYRSGHFPQAFPLFGAERRGASCVTAVAGKCRAVVFIILPV